MQNVTSPFIHGLEGEVGIIFFNFGGYHCGMLNEFATIQFSSVQLYEFSQPIEYVKLGFLIKNNSLIKGLNFTTFAKF